MVTAQGARSFSRNARRRSRGVSSTGTRSSGRAEARLLLVTTCRYEIPAFAGMTPVASFLAEGEAAETLVEARDLAARIEQLAVAAGPGRMDLGVDVELQRVAFLAVGRTGLEGGAVGHLHRDLVIIGVEVALHRLDFLGFGWFRPASMDAHCAARGLL